MKRNITKLQYQVARNDLYAPKNGATDLQALKNRVTQEFPDQEADQENEVDQTHPSLVPYEGRKHNQVQCKTQALAYSVCLIQPILYV